MSDEETTAGDVARDILLILGGALIGAAVSLLYAPQTGTRTRREIVRKVDNVKHKAQDIGDDVLSKVEDLRQHVSKQMDEGLDYVGEKRDVFLNNLSSLEDKLGSIRKKIGKR